jgi:hypothetical protein
LMRQKDVVYVHDHTWSQSREYFQKQMIYVTVNLERV